MLISKYLKLIRQQVNILNMTILIKKIHIRDYLMPQNKTKNTIIS